MIDELLILVKGAGDLATGVGWRLHRCGFNVVMTEVAHPLTVRRTVAFAQAVFDGSTLVEGITARCANVADVPDVLQAGEVPVVVDPNGEAVQTLVPSVLVDAIMAKRNLGTSIYDAELVVALGPGFKAGVDCHAVIETHRGHTLGRVIWEGSARADTGTPGPLPGIGMEGTRVLRAPATGRLKPRSDIGETVDAGSLIATVVTETGEMVPLPAPFSGVLRGLIHASVPVTKGLKIGDLDPRIEPGHAWTISDKSLAVGGAVLEAILHWHVDRRQI